MSGLKVLQARPSAGLKNVVRCFQERVGDVGRQPVFLPLPARAEQFLEFYFSDPYRIRERASGEVSRAPGAVIVGAQTFRRADLLLQGELRLFTIQFTPTGLHALFGVPADELTDQAVPLEALLGEAGRELRDRLGSAAGFAERVRVAEAWLGPRVAAGGRDAVSLASRLLTRTHGAVGVGALKARYGVSARQFDRAFTRQVGMAPKVYARMLRFQRALALKQAGSASSWTQVAQAAGYFDQAHMIRDFRAFADATPTQFFAALVPAEAQAVKGPPGENIQSATPREV